MDNLWRQYLRMVIWPGEQFEEQHPEVEPKRLSEKIKDWEDYAIENFGVETLPLTK